VRILQGKKEGKKEKRLTLKRSFKNGSRSYLLSLIPPPVLEKR